jgi:hypothetical protein
MADKADGKEHWPKVYFGAVNDDPVNWQDMDDDDPDDEELAETPADVVFMLGFDPAKAA